MSLSPSLYAVESRSADGLAFRLRLNAASPIYAAHFPGEPVTPGAVLIKIAEELFGAVLGRRVSTVGVRGVKFLAILSPETTPAVDVAFTRIAESGEQGGLMSAQVVVSNAGVTFARIGITVC